MTVRLRERLVDLPEIDPLERSMIDRLHLQTPRLLRMPRYIRAFQFTKVTLKGRDVFAQKNTSTLFFFLFSS